MHVTGRSGERVVVIQEHLVLLTSVQRFSGWPSAGEIHRSALFCHWTIRSDTIH